MSRRLDALFAERVMGRIVTHSVIHRQGASDDGWAWEHPVGVGHILMEGGLNPLHSYISDLSAAWVGVEKLLAVDPLDRQRWEGFALRLEDDSPVQWYAYGESRSATKRDHASASTPALAVVLACLRAVGVSEEEIQQAASDGLGGIAEAQGGGDV